MRTRVPPSFALLAILTAVLPAAELPANQWVKVDEKKDGKRWAAATVWLEKKKQLLVLGGVIVAEKGGAAPADVRTFDPATGAWADRQVKLDRKALRFTYENGFAWDAATGRILGLVPSGVWLDGSVKLVAYDVSRDAATELAAQGAPFGDVSAPFKGTGHPWLRGAATGLDPVAKELLVVGGHCGGVPGGTVGPWAYSLETGAWRALKFSNASSDEVTQALCKAQAAQKDLVAAARNLFYAATPAEKKAASAKEKLAPQQAAVLEEIKKLPGAAGLDAESSAAAQRLVKEALDEAKRAADALAAGTLDAATIAAAENAAWRIDEAASAAAPAPPARYRPAMAYDPERKMFVLFGGDHGDYVLSDTWTYDPARRAWKQLWPAVAPSARLGAAMVWLPKSKRIALVGGDTCLRKMVYQRFTEPLPADVWLLDGAKGTWAPAFLLAKDAPVPVISSVPVVAGDDTLVALSASGSEYRDIMVGSTWQIRIDAAAADAATPPGAKSAGPRTYRSVVQVYDPQWYDAAPRGDPDEVAKWLAAIPANEWVTVPRSPRPAGERSWGTALFDPERDQMYYWTGGHCADPSDAVQHYHPGINRWSIGYAAGGVGKGIGFTGRPDCMNHTYKNYAFDLVSKLMVAPHQAGTHVYDPDRREWTRYTPNQPFTYEIYETKCVGTSRGVVAWAAKPKLYFGLFDAAAMAWKELPVTGTVPRVGGDDGGGMTWDSKRGVLYLHAAKGYEKYDGEVYRYSFETGEMTPLHPKNKETIGDRFPPRESVYLPDVDLILFGMGFIGGKQVAYDVAGNRWVLLANVTKMSRTVTWDAAKGEFVRSEAKPQEHVGSISFVPVLDARRGVLWAPSDYKDLYVMRIDPKTLKIVESAE